MFYKKIALIFLILLVSLTGCREPIYDQTEANVADVKEKVDFATTNAAKIAKTSSLVVKDGIYVDKTPINLAEDPSWLKNRIILRGDQLPFSYYSRTIVSGGGDHTILTRYQTGLDEKQMISMNYSGTVKGALDLLAAKTGYLYTVNGCNIYWQAFVTKTYEIAFMPGSSDYMMGKSAGSTGPAAAAGSGTGAAGSGTTVTGTIDDSAASQYSNLKGTLSIWKDLEASIKEMLTPEGRVVVSEATTSVMVRDRPNNVSLVGRFIQNLNGNLTKQVLVKIEILQVTLESDYNFGINWNVVQHAFGNGSYQLVANNGSPISITSATGLVGNLAVAGLNNQSVANNVSSGNDASGVITLINALKQQGKVSVATQPQVLCQNNQVSEIRIIDQQGYLASVQTTSLAGAATTAGASITSQITPGAVVTGFTLYVLPKILNDKVYLQVNADLSNFLGIETITSNGATLTPGTAPPAGTSIIQVPHVQQKQFNQRSVIGSGDTLILAGFRQVSNQVGASQLFNSQSLGGKTSQQISTETVVLITPIVLHGTA